MYAAFWKFETAACGMYVSCVPIGATTGTPVGLLIILFDLGVFGVQYASDASLESDVRLRRACEVPRERFIPFCHDVCSLQPSQQGEEVLMPRTSAREPDSKDY